MAALQTAETKTQQYIEILKHYYIIEMLTLFSYLFPLFIVNHFHLCSNIEHPIDSFYFWELRWKNVLSLRFCK